MKEKLFELDKNLEYLINELKSHHLFDKLNLIVTSDHGSYSFLIFRVFNNNFKYKSKEWKRFLRKIRFTWIRM